MCDKYILRWGSGIETDVEASTGVCIHCHCVVYARLWFLLLKKLAWQRFRLLLQLILRNDRTGWTGVQKEKNDYAAPKLSKEGDDVYVSLASTR